MSKESSPAIKGNLANEPSSMAPLNFDLHSLSIAQTNEK